MEKRSMSYKTERWFLNSRTKDVCYKNQKKKREREIARLLAYVGETAPFIPRVSVVFALKKYGWFPLKQWLNHHSHCLFFWINILSAYSGLGTFWVSGVCPWTEQTVAGWGCSSVGKDFLSMLQGFSVPSPAQQGKTNKQTDQDPCSIPG